MRFIEYRSTAYRQTVLAVKLASGCSFVFKPDLRASEVRNGVPGIQSCKQEGKFSVCEILLENINLDFAPGRPGREPNRGSLGANLARRLRPRGGYHHEYKQDRC